MSGGHLCEAEAPTEPAGETMTRSKGYNTSLNGRFVNRPYYNRNAVPTLCTLRFAFCTLLDKLKFVTLIFNKLLIFENYLALFSSV